MTVTYEFELVAACPVDGKPDVYACTVRASRTIPVEDILRAAADLALKKLYQEDLTVSLQRTLAAEVTTVGWHSGVKTTVKGG